MLKSFLSSTGTISSDESTIITHMKNLLFSLQIKNSFNIKKSISLLNFLVGFFENKKTRNGECNWFVAFYHLSKNDYAYKTAYNISN